jgi:hypothetical protein
MLGSLGQKLSEIVHHDQSKSELELLARDKDYVDKTCPIEDEEFSEN